MSVVDDLFAAVSRGDPQAFAEWMGRVERPIRASLARFAQATDVEGIVQETLLRMWHFAQDRDRTLTGENASLRFAIGMARNLARHESRRLKRERYLPPEDMPDMPVDPPPEPDPRLRRFIRECLERLARRPRQALRARLEHGPRASDRFVAGLLGMTPNTFFQNIARARQQLRDCLVRKGVPAEELPS